MTIDALPRIAIVDDARANTSYFIQKNHQNNLKGLLWGTAGAAATVTVLAITAGVVVGVPVAILASAGSVMNDYSRNTLGPLVPVTVAGAVVVAYLNKKIVQATGACFRNAIYHLGPEYQIVAQRKSNNIILGN